MIPSVRRRGDIGALPPSCSAPGRVAGPCFIPSHARCTRLRHSMLRSGVMPSAVTSIPPLTPDAATDAATHRPRPRLFRGQYALRREFAFSPDHRRSPCQAYTGAAAGMSAYPSLVRNARCDRSIGRPSWHQSSSCRGCARGSRRLTFPIFPIRSPPVPDHDEFHIAFSGLGHYIVDGSGRSPFAFVSMPRMV